MHSKTMIKLKKITEINSGKQLGLDQNLLFFASFFW